MEVFSGDEKRYAGLSAEEIAAAVMADRCRACRHEKTPGFAFCKQCTAALTWMQRADLAAGAGGPNSLKFEAQFGQAFNCALRHLEGLPARPSEVADAIRWPYRREDELEAAGFFALGHGRCAVPKCWAQITWFRTPKGKRMPLNFRHPDDPQNLRPHRESCADPDYFERLKAAKLERRKQRRAARGCKRLQGPARAADEKKAARHGR